MIQIKILLTLKCNTKEKGYRKEQCTRFLYWFTQTWATSS